MRTTQLIIVFQVVVAAAMLASFAPAQDKPADEPVPSPREVLVQQAEALRPMVTTPFAKQMLDAVPSLPAIETRTIYYDPRSQKAVTAEAAQAIDPAELVSWKKLDLDEQFYYFTRYGTPLASVRSFDLAAAASPNLATTAGKRIADFGYGTIGQLRLLASQGAHATGIEVDPILEALYSADNDTGKIVLVDGSAASEPGEIKLVTGSWPADESIKGAVGEGYDLFISKNTLKRGYVHPEREVDPRMLVHLKVDDAAFVRDMFTMLKPGGVAIIYNISPAPSKPDEPYRPWTDGRCPFAREIFEQVGFEVVEYDKDDTAFVKSMALALGWQEAMDIENDLFAHYTLVRKPAK